MVLQASAVEPGSHSQIAETARTEAVCASRCVRTACGFVSKETAGRSCATWTYCCWHLAIVRRYVHATRVVAYELRSRFSRFRFKNSKRQPLSPHVQLMLCTASELHS
jgi:hypothetical protein